MPRSAIIWTRSRELSLNVRYHRMHRTIISWSKCRPLNERIIRVSQVFQASLETLSLRRDSQFPIVVIIKLADFVRSGFVPLRPFKYQPNMVGVTSGYSSDR